MHNYVATQQRNPTCHIEKVGEISTTGFGVHTLVSDEYLNYLLCILSSYLGQATSHSLTRFTLIQKLDS